MIRPTVAHVDLHAITSNLADIRRFLDAAPRPGPAPAIIAVVKANAYGHGLERVGRTLAEAGASCLACADVAEGMALREAGVAVPILIFGALGVSDLSGLFTHDLTPTVSSPTAARALEQAAERRGTGLSCHLKIDTGMNRLGFRHDNLRRTIPTLTDCGHLAVDGLYTHFASADDPADPSFDAQRRRFDDAVRVLREMGVAPRMRHAANSAALIRDPRCWYEAVRPGILLYGLAPGPAPTPMALRPAMSLRSRVTAVKGVRAGEAVGYGRRFVARRPSTVAIVPAGYADGIDGRLAGRGEVLVRGRRAPIIGSICMDMIVIDVTGYRVEPNDEVVILGTQGEQSIDAREMASIVDTIPYEVVCRIGSRIERVYNERAIPPSA